MSAAANVAFARVRLGFVGLGWIGRKRLDGIAADPAIEVAALCDTMGSRLDAAASTYCGAVAATSLEDVLRTEIDGVVIATPSGFHASQAMRCLARGIAVFCQKPLTTSARATREVIGAARAADRLLEVDFCYRYVVGMHELKRRIASGALGEITAIDLTFHNAYGPNRRWCFDRAAAGGGCLLDLGVHLLDLALWLQDFPDVELESVRRIAQGRPAPADAIEDQAFIQLRQANGAVVRLACSWYAQIGCDAHIELRVLGTKGGAVWNNLDGSFYDFELHVCRGAQRERLARAPDNWGSRALVQWVHKLAADRSFDPAAFDIARSAELIDEAYLR